MLSNRQCLNSGSYFRLVQINLPVAFSSPILPVLSINHIVDS